MEITAFRNDRRNLVVGDNDAVFQRKAADGGSVVRENLRHDVGTIVLQLADLGQIGGVDENQAAQRPDSCGK